MDLRVGSVVIDVNDLGAMKDFWRAALGFEVEVERDDWVKLAPPGGKGTNVSLQLVPEHRHGKNRLHLDLYTSHQRAEVERVVQLGATVEREASEGEDFVVLGDPEGNLFCIIDAREIS